MFGHGQAIGDRLVYPYQKSEKKTPGTWKVIIVPKFCRFHVVDNYGTSWGKMLNKTTVSTSQ
jgi:hypothetical protein